MVVNSAGSPNSNCQGIPLASVGWTRQTRRREQPERPLASTGHSSSQTRKTDGRRPRLRHHDQSASLSIRKVQRSARVKGMDIRGPTLLYLRARERRALGMQHSGMR